MSNHSSFCALFCFLPGCPCLACPLAPSQQAPHPASSVLVPLATSLSLNVQRLLSQCLSVQASLENSVDIKKFVSCLAQNGPAPCAPHQIGNVWGSKMLQLGWAVRHACCATSGRHHHHHHPILLTTYCCMLLLLFFIAVCYQSVLSCSSHPSGWYSVAMGCTACSVCTCLHQQHHEHYHALACILA